MKQKIIDSLYDGLSFVPSNRGIGNFLTALSNNGLKLVEKCDCEPFQSCEKCATEWKNIPQGMKIDTEYWLLDASNKIGRGMKKQHTITLFFSQCEEDFGIPVMFAEIKPPETP